MLILRTILKRGDKNNDVLKKRVLAVFTIIVTAFLISALILIIVDANKINDDDIVLSVNGEPVSKTEYLFIMSGLKANVFSYFSNKHGVEESSGFWSSDFQGEVPEQVLRQQTIELLKRIKIEQILMREYGIADDISFSGFLGKLENENKRRELALAQHQPVYGPVRFEEKVYFDYLHSERAGKLKRILTVSELSVSKAELDRSCDEFLSSQENKDELTDVEGLRIYLKNELLNRKYEEMIRNLMDTSITDIKLKDSEFRKLSKSLLNY